MSNAGRLGTSIALCVLFSMPMSAWSATASNAAAPSGESASLHRPTNIAPIDLPALTQLASDLRHAGRFEEAKTKYQALADANPWDGSAWLGLSDCEKGLHHPTEAIEDIKKALALGFGYRANRDYEIAELYAGSGNPELALDWLQRALDAGYESRPEIGADPAFAGLVSDTRFRKIALLPDAKPPSRDEGWRSDLDILVHEAKRLSAGPRPVAMAPEFDAAAEKLRREIPKLSNEEIYVGMQRLVASLGNGHSVLFPLSTHLLDFKMLPIDLYMFSDGLYVIGGSGDAARYVGFKVERIGNADPDKAMALAAPVIDRDNPMGLAWNGPYLLTYPAILNAVGIETGAPPNEVRLELRDREGRTVVATLQGGAFRPPSKLVGPPGNASGYPLYLQHPDEALSLESLPAAAALYIRYNQVADEPNMTTAQFAQTLLARAAAEHTDNLIVDVRRNNGGSGDLNRPILRALIQFEGQDHGHHVYVITGRNTFSAAQNFINEVDRYTDATFVGEPSSSRPNFVGEDTEISLPFSGITGSMSARYFQDGYPQDERVWIAPAIPVALSSRDYFANRDPVLEATLDAIRHNREPHP